MSNENKDKRIAELETENAQLKAELDKVKKKYAEHVGKFMDRLGNVENLEDGE